MDNEERTFGTVGPIVRVKWYDAAAQMKINAINGNNPTEHLAVCESVGELVAEDRKALILVQHWSDTDGVDILAIPKDWCQDIEVLKEVKECISENLESQQE
jgi:DNA polymerase/3'-5' exonuclease PolX